MSTAPSVSGEVAATVGALALAAPLASVGRLQVVEHCPLDEYNRQQERWFGDRPVAYLRQWAAARFQATYPDLRTWQSTPLATRVGWTTTPSPDGRRAPRLRDLNDPHTRGVVNYNARPYLHYLVFTGRLQLDWTYLLGVASTSPWLVADRLGLRLREQLDALTAQRDVINDSSARAGTGSCPAWCCTGATPTCRTSPTRTSRRSTRPS